MEAGMQTWQWNFPKVPWLSKSPGLSGHHLFPQIFPVFFTPFNGVLTLFDPCCRTYLHAAGARKLLQNQKG
jgi:hypothetical protein